MKCPLSDAQLAAVCNFTTRCRQKITKTTHWGFKVSGTADVPHPARLTGIVAVDEVLQRSLRVVDLQQPKLYGVYITVREEVLSSSRSPVRGDRQINVDAPRKRTSTPEVSDVSEELLTPRYIN
ncbi:Hypothetical protein SMAX5B_000764, partial [Scophthalmus maximus]